jgi:hypothetical protein
MLEVPEENDKWVLSEPAVISLLGFLLLSAVISFIIQKLKIGLISLNSLSYSLKYCTAFRQAI